MDTNIGPPLRAYLRRVPAWSVDSGGFSRLDLATGAVTPTCVLLWCPSSGW